MSIHYKTDSGQIYDHSAKVYTVIWNGNSCRMQGRRSHGGSGGSFPRCPLLTGARGGSHVPFATITISYNSF